MQGCAKVLIDSTAEGVCAHVKTLFDRGASIIEELRTILTENGHSADEFLPLKSSAHLLAGLCGLMHGTCATANAAAQRIVEAKNAAGIEHYGAEEWAALDPSKRETFDVLCFNHTRQLPVTAYNRLSKVVLEELLAPYAAQGHVPQGPDRRARQSLRPQTSCQG